MADCTELQGSATATAGDAPTRRDVVRGGAKLVFVAPVISTFFAHEAYAANYSCYPQNHVCHTTGDFEPCCGGLSCNGNPGICIP